MFVCFVGKPHPHQFKPYKHCRYNAYYIIIKSVFLLTVTYLYCHMNYEEAVAGARVPIQSDLAISRCY